MNGDPMSAHSRTAVAEGQQQGTGIFVSPITAWEIGTLASRNRIRLKLSPEAWFEALLDLPGVRLAPMTPSILIASTALPGVPPSDPADRIIAATARAFGWTVVTRDSRLTRYAADGHIGVLVC